MIIIFKRNDVFNVTLLLVVNMLTMVFNKPSSPFPSIWVEVSCITCSSHILH